MSRAQFQSGAARRSIELPFESSSENGKPQLKFGGYISQATTDRWNWLLLFQLHRAVTSTLVCTFKIM